MFMLVRVCVYAFLCVRVRVSAVVALAKTHGCMTVADNTFASSHNTRPLSLGVDVVLHSATKYLNGHADVTAGAIMGSRAAIDACWVNLKLFGAVCHPMVCPVGTFSCQRVVSV